MDATNVYWATGADGTLLQVPIGGGAPVTLVAAGTVGNPGLGVTAVDATDVYYVASFQLNQAPDGGVLATPTPS